VLNYIISIENVGYGTYSTYNCCIGLFQISDEYLLKARFAAGAFV